MSHVKDSDDSKLKIHLVKGKRVWSVEVDGPLETATWGTRNGAMQTKTRFYDAGKSNRNPNQQARLNALSVAKRKMDLGYTADGKIIDILDKEEDAVPNAMLASICSLEKIKSKKFFVQPKLDGLRCLANLKTGELYSRSRQHIDTLLHLSEQLKLGKSEFQWADGELYCHDLSIQSINSIVRNSHSLDHQRHMIQFHAFDAVISDPFRVRLSHIQNWVASLPSQQYIKLTDTFHVEHQDLEAKHHDLTENGFEGLIIRMDDDTPYKQGTRSRSLQKLKSFQREEFPCVGILAQKHTTERLAGSFTLALPNGKVFNAQPKCSMKEKYEIWENKETYLDGKYMAMVQYAQLSNDGIPIFPVIVGFRHTDDM